MAIRAVILDIGGVLERNPPTGWQDRWAARTGMSRAELERRLAPVLAPGAVGGITLEQVHAGIAEALGIDAATTRELMEDVWVEYVGELDREIAAWFTSLRPRLRTAMLSNSFVGGRERERAAHGLESMCELIVYSHEEGMLKPDRRIYELTCERLGVPPQEAVFVDDKPENVEGARRAGMHAVEHRGDAAATIAAVQALLASGP